MFRVETSPRYESSMGFRVEMFWVRGLSGSGIVRDSYTGTEHEASQSLQWFGTKWLKRLEFRFMGLAGFSLKLQTDNPLNSSLEDDLPKEVRTAHGATRGELVRTAVCCCEHGIQRLRV